MKLTNLEANLRTLLTVIGLVVPDVVCKSCEGKKCKKYLCGWFALVALCAHLCADIDAKEDGQVEKLGRVPNYIRKAKSVNR